MKRLGLFLAAALVGAAVALIYFCFEGVVHHGIELIWAGWLDTGAKRWLVIPVCLVTSLIYFGLQHRLDPASERHESHGLGSMPEPTPTNFAKVLFIGFCSLVAGASLGPEAVLVPACMIAGSYAGVTLFKRDKQAIRLLGALGFIALMAAFFHSFIAGMLGLLLVKKQAKAKLNLEILVLAAVASWATVYMLGLLDSPSFVRLPNSGWHFNIKSALVLALLSAGGYAATYGLKTSDGLVRRLHDQIASHTWWLRGLVAATGLAALYLLGGSLVEFTGNKSIIPMLDRATELGVLGLAWLAIIKIAAISWSNAMGYRGGLVFPIVFVASILVAIAQLRFPELNFAYGLLATMVGVLVAERRAKILF